MTHDSFLVGSEVLSSVTVLLFRQELSRLFLTASPSRCSRPTARLTLLLTTSWVSNFLISFQSCILMHDGCISEALDCCFLALGSRLSSNSTSRQLEYRLSVVMLRVSTFIAKRKYSFYAVWPRCLSVEAVHLDRQLGQGQDLCRFAAASSLSLSLAHKGKGVPTCRSVSTSAAIGNLLPISLSPVNESSTIACKLLSGRRTAALHFRVR